MLILFFCPRWGSEHLSWDDFFSQVKSAGYNGVEYAIPTTATKEDLDMIWQKASAHQLLMIAQHYDTYTRRYLEHYEHYNQWFKKVLPLKPFKINSQTGKDFFSVAENSALIALADELAQVTDVPISHETHRNKFSFAAHQMPQYLRNIESLRLTLDASHWVCVAESLLEDQAESMQLAISRTDHIHARIGHAQGPQVPDPRMKEWQPALQAHLNWWDDVVQIKKRNDAILTITTEFGPFPYMVNVPGTGSAIADQWELNIFMMNLLKNRYN